MTAATTSSTNLSLPRTLSAFILGSVALLVFLGGLLITGIQAYYSYVYIQAILRKSNLDEIAMHIPSWSRVFMVDLAVVAQALVSFTAGCVVLGSWRVIKNSASSGSLETFPFPKRYRTYYIQLGLWGTVVGFVIGFWNLSGTSEQAPKILLVALSASLWSTLTAITLAYIVCPLTETFFRSYLLPFRGADASPLDELANQASAAATALQQLTMTSSTADMNLSLHTVANQLLSVQKELAAVNGQLQWTTERISSFDREVSVVKSAIEQLQRSSRDSCKDINELDSRALKLRLEVEEGDKRIREEVALLQDRRQEQVARVIKICGGLMDRLRRSLET